MKSWVRLGHSIYCQLFYQLTDIMKQYLKVNHIKLLKKTMGVQNKISQETEKKTCRLPNIDILKAATRQEVRNDIKSYHGR